MKHLILAFVSALIISGCSSSSDDVEEELLPENLSVSVTPSTQVPGLVGITFNADNTNFFTIDYGVGLGFEEINTQSTTFQYTESGDYTITVRAHKTEDMFIEESEQVTVTVSSSGPISDEGYSTPLSYSGYTLVWNDEFDGTQLSADWTHEIGTGNNGWGNNELQYYRSNNTSLGNGYLTIEARNENFSGSEYTSSRIITEGQQFFQYGRIDIRAILPEGQGLWPALWMLGSNFRTVGWPFCGEIDIMEMVGGSGRENNVFGTLHWDDNGTYACTCGQGDGFTLSSGTFADEFHVFSIIWDETEIKWYVDDNLYKTIDISPAGLDEFRAEFFFIFNIAVGGNLPGNPNSSTQFPQQMVVDYVRVFQEN